MKTTKKILWTPAHMLKRPDNLMSSEYTNLQAAQFVPSYEKDEVNMYYLLSMEYAKIWLKEKAVEKKIALSSVDSDFLVRRYVIRGLLLRRKEQEKEKKFKMKRFENIPSKIRIRTKEEIDKLTSKLTDKEKAEIEEIAKTGASQKKEPTENELQNTN